MSKFKQPYTAVLAGIDAELLILARKAGVEVVAVSDNKATGLWRGFSLIPEEAADIIKAKAQGVILGLDSPKLKKRLDAFFSEMNMRPVDIVGGEIDSSSEHDCGFVLQSNAVVSANCKIGRCVKINMAALVMHDVVLGDYVTVAPRAVLLGRVKVMNGSFIGANATILPDVTIGIDVVVGAGAVVTRDVPNGSTVVGVPAKMINT